MTDFNPHGDDLFGAVVKRPHTSKLGDEFLIPPFTVLNAREGWWQDRKRAWLALGIQSELGRGEDANLTFAQGGGMHVTEPGLNYYRNRTATADQTLPAASAAPTTSGPRGLSESADRTTGSDGHPIHA